MKGATAEILVRIIRPPRTSIISKMGSSQNFFRSRIKDQSSIKVDTALVPLNGDPRFKALLRKMNLPE